MDSNFFLHYPVWELGIFGGGFWIAAIAVFHVYIAHFAVGGGLFLVLTEMKGYRENSQEILDYTKKHSKFFLLISMVFGSITGVGIWFTISLLSPAATSTLIHYFVFGWAAEWVFFLGEIVALFIYYYTFGKMDKKDHLKIGWIYFAFAWLSLFVINGIITFMLTPGEWLKTKDFWDGFFNPSFFPSLFFRTFMAFMLAGLFGFITSVNMKIPTQECQSYSLAKKDVRESMIRYCAWWLLIPFGFLLEAGWWYATALPEPQKAMILSGSPEIIPFLNAFICISAIIFVIGVFMAIRVPIEMKKALSFILLFIGLAYMGSFEWIREAGRRPYLIYGYSYSNGALAEDVEAISKAGLLKSARWVKNREINDDNQIDAGHEIFNLLCISCHSVRGRINDIIPLTQKYNSVFGMDSFLDGMGKINEYMPVFMGNEKERKALAAYIVKEVGSQESGVRSQPPSALPVEIPTFDEENDDYILLAWSGRGIYIFSDNDKYFNLSFPGNDIYAQLIRRGETPEIITDGVKITYRTESGFKNPSDFNDFWKYSSLYFKKEIPQDTGISGKGTDGEMDFDNSQNLYAAKGIPVVPYAANFPAYISNLSSQLSIPAFHFNPYPLITVEARDKESDEIIAATKITAPVSTEMGCNNCHGGEWRVNNINGLSDETAEDILLVHDRMSKTNLAEMAEKGNPKSCQECHSSSDKKYLNLSAAIHGFHANYLTKRESEACSACHPSDGFTKGFRGIHKEVSLNCTNCHGTLEDHSLALLLKEKASGKKSADKLIKNLSPRSADKIEDITPKSPWVNQPDCLNCHVDFNPPETDTADINQWTKTEKQQYGMRADDVGIRCAACHGAAHAIYPATNIFGNDRDNIPPVQYQKNPYPIGANKNCKVCHKTDMEEEVHHPNSLNMFRNVR